MRKMFFKILQKPQENICVAVSLLIKMQTSGLQFYLKKTPKQVFSCPVNVSKLLRTHFFTEHLRVTSF